MNKRIVYSIFVHLVFCGYAAAQTSGTIPRNAVPIGKGPGVIGFGSASPGTSGFPLTSNGPSVDPSFQQIGFAAISGSWSCAQAPALTGNVTSSAGSCATSIAALAVTNGMLAGYISASKLVGTDIATVGTITSGTWNGSVIAGSYGGTGNAFMQFTGPATSIKTYLLPNVSDTITTINSAQTLTNKTINCANNSCTVRLANDVVGNLPVGNLAGASGASATTFWRGDGTWNKPDVRNIVRVFTSNTTWTPTSGTTSVVIYCYGGGGGSGGVVGSATYALGSGGGGAGSYSIAYKTAAQIGASQSVIIGAGGAAGSSGANNGGAGGGTSVGSLCIAPGGSGGLYAQQSVQTGSGGLGAAAGTGDITIPGTDGQAGIYAPFSSINAAYGGYGGPSALGGGKGGAAANGNAVSGVAGIANTGGGAGGAAVSGIAANASGAAGGTGLVVIIETVVN